MSRSEASNSGESNAISEASTISSFQHIPLDQSVDCFRLVYLQPRRKEKHDHKIRCTLSHVKFGDMPQYEALSYAWGDDTVKRTILLNEENFEVGENLAAALINIRGLESAGETPRALWIDAICINQSDLAERSRQVRFMPYIYQRAQMVLVWLGSGSSFKDHCASEYDLSKMNIPKQNSQGFPTLDSQSAKKSRLLELCHRPYWKRLWIIQEIGKARRLRLHYDTESRIWWRFIEDIEKFADPSNNIPLKLSAQLADRYGNGHLLSNLLRNHQTALCKEPRDKIYGLLGLAIDVDEGFPIDYSKSLFEVFTDTVLFQNRDQTRSQHDILELSRIISRMLGGPAGLEPDGPARNFDAGNISLKPNNAQFQALRIPGRLSGRITCVGPLHSDMMAKIEKLNEWKSLIRGNISDFPLKSAIFEQSDLFLEMLEHFDEVSQRTVFAFDRRIKWVESQQHSLENFEQMYGKNDATAATTQLAYPAQNGSQMFLLQPLALDGQESWMGLAPRGTQGGDFVCRISGIERAVIVRQSSIMDPYPTYRIIGCAGLARGLAMARKVKEERVPHSLFSVGPLTAPDKLEQLNLCMDIHTAYDISS